MSAHTPLESIRALILDVDGVMTDGRLFYGANGEELKVFHVHDGLGIKQLMSAGFGVAVISGRRTAAVEARCRELGIEHLEQGCEDKVAALERACRELGVAPTATLCVVDDTSDLGLCEVVGFSVAVADAHPQVRAATDRVTGNGGGRGAVREVCDWLIAARGHAT